MRVRLQYGTDGIEAPVHHRNVVAARELLGIGEDPALEAGPGHGADVGRNPTTGSLNR